MSAQQAGQPLISAVTTQREGVLNSFDAQRDAIIKAVDEQRRVAMDSTKGGQQPRIAGRPIGQPAPQPPAPSRQQIIGEIVQTLKALVAEEVRAQLLALLAAADAKQNSNAQPPASPPAPGDGVPPAPAGEK